MAEHSTGRLSKAERSRIHAAERRGAAVLVASAASLALPLLATAVWTPPILFVWNASSSAPEGLYGIAPFAAVRRGEMVAAWLPPTARRLAAKRGYLPSSVPIVKEIAAAGGDRICANRASIFVNGRNAATRIRNDRLGRAMPSWAGCIRLTADQYLLMTNNPLSFDGRYFGVTRKDELIGRATLIWRA